MTAEKPFRAMCENVMAALQVLRDKFGGSEWGAYEKDESFKSAMGCLSGFQRSVPFSSVKEKATNLLYLMVKNHSFSGDNKRILVPLVLGNNQILYRLDDSRLLDSNTLVVKGYFILKSYF